MKKSIKLSEWARMSGVNLRTAQRMHSRGDLPVPAMVSSTGRVLVLVDEDWYHAQHLKGLVQNLVDHIHKKPNDL